MCQTLRKGSLWRYYDDKCQYKARVVRVACAKRLRRGHDGDTMMTSATIKHELGVLPLSGMSPCIGHLGT